MILESMPTETFSISFDSEIDQFTLMKKTGHTWHRVLLTRDDILGVLILLQDMDDKKVFESMDDKKVSEDKKILEYMDDKEVLQNME